MEATALLLLSQKKLKNKSIDLHINTRNNRITENNNKKKQILLKRNNSNYKEIYTGIYSLYDKISVMRNKEDHVQIHSPILPRQYSDFSQNVEYEEIKLFETELKTKKLEESHKLLTGDKTKVLLSPQLSKNVLLNQGYTKLYKAQDVIFPPISINSIKTKKQII